jgi:molybdate/tungstate transport system substrate-binding protein
MKARTIAVIALLSLTMTAAAATRRPNRPGTLTVMNAASITLPIRAALDSFSARTGVKYEVQPGSSLEIARRFTELHQTADVVFLADPEVFPQLMMPAYVHWYALFARNRIVLAYTDRSRGAKEINSENWRAVITRAGVEVGRSDPNTDPSGYRTLLTMQLAARHYHDPGLFARLLAAAPERNVRPRESEQVVLLQTGELDYVWTYQNLAENDGLRVVKLPDDIDLGNPADSAIYASVSTRVLGKAQGDTVTMRGAPILFAFTIPLGAENPDLARRFAEYVSSADDSVGSRLPFSYPSVAPVDLVGHHAVVLQGDGGQPLCCRWRGRGRSGWFGARAQPLRCLHRHPRRAHHVGCAVCRLQRAG